MPSTRSMVSKVSVVTRRESHLESLVTNFMVSAWKSYDSSTMQVNDWARNQTRRFYHEVSKVPKFADVYTSLMQYAKIMSPDKAPLEGDAALVGVIVADDNMTDMEERTGRAKLNAVLFREHTRWWDAFVEEVKEDTDVDAPSASDRFSYHCATILTRMTGLKRELIVPVVGAWLIEKTV